MCGFLSQTNVSGYTPVFNQFEHTEEARPVLSRYPLLPRQPKSRKIIDVICSADELGFQIQNRDDFQSKGREENQAASVDDFQTQITSSHVHSSMT